MLFLPRLVPDEPLPAYSYVPGLFPHPISDPAGHSHGQRRHPAAPLDPQHWRQSRDFLIAIDLFNHGYYWEAHEAWEGLWLAAGRTGIVADFLKGLIQLTAAGVKVRQGMPSGVRSLAEGASNHFERVLHELLPGATRLAGLEVTELLHFTRELAARSEFEVPPPEPVVRVFDLVLSPKDEQSSKEAE